MPDAQHPFYPVDQTHDPSLKSWIESANDPSSEFPIQNLPFCRAQRLDEIEAEGGDASMAPEFLATRIGEVIVDLEALADAGLLDAVRDEDGESVMGFALGAFLDEAEPKVRVAFRRQLSALLSTLDDRLRENDALREEALTPVDRCVVRPAHEPRDYTDFYASVYHATNVGSMFRPGNALLPNYKHVPIGYHGRASTVVPSGTPIVRPKGQQSPAEEGGTPSFAPCRMLDYELEVGFVVGRPNPMGETIPLARAEAHILGLCLVNDWSARDVQKWEYQPLGPFLAKNFATTVSPYLVTLEALAPFRTPAFERPAADPAPLPYLTDDRDRALGGIDLTLEVYLRSAQMREQGLEPVRISRGSFRDMYWTIAQLLTHHASNGCAMEPGDLLASGTVSGKTRESRGCLLELTWDGDAFANPPVLVPGTQRTPIQLPTGETRTFLADGDEVVLRGFCEREGYRRIGFGDCTGIITPAK